MSIKDISQVSDRLVRNRFIDTAIADLNHSIARCTRATSISSRKSQIKQLISLR